MIRITGGILLFIAAGLGVLGLLTWPPGGLMFALPYVFLLPAGVVALAGALLLALSFVGSRKPNSKEADHE